MANTYLKSLRAEAKEFYKVSEQRDPGYLKDENEAFEYLLGFAELDLKLDIKAAIAREDHKTAAILRDKIKELSPKPLSL